jgi:DNA modification methylase
MKIELVSIDDLDLDPRNARKHDAKNLKAIADSLDLFGQRKPIVVWGRTVVAGNGTMAAARSLGWKEITVARVPDDWTADQVKAYALADNRSAELASWDEEVLASQLLELQEAEFDIELLGFELPVDELSEVVEDEIPEQVEPKSKLGDVWKLGRHRLICGDATDTATVQKLMQGNDADLIFTDPPYNLDFSGQDLSSTTKDGKKINHYVGQNTKHEQIKNDALPRESFEGFITNVLNNLWSLNPKSWYFTFTDLTLDQLLVPMRNVGFEWKSVLVWMKNQATLSGKDYKSRYEPIVYGCKSGAFYAERYLQEDIWQFQRTLKNDLHPTMKPIPLIVQAIQNSSRSGESVVDVFGGSGSTLIACEQTDRTCYMMELDPKYVDVIIARWEKLTGLTAELIEG